MDVHRELDVTPADVAAAHELDLSVQHKHNVRYLQWWYNDTARAVYCLVDAPSRDAAIAVHREANGLLPAEVIEVEVGNVAAFLGETKEDLLQDKELVAMQHPVRDTAFRAILFTDMEGSTTLTQRLGDAESMKVLNRHDELIDDGLRAHGGSRIKHTGDGCMASFPSASMAMECAIRLQRAFALHNQSDTDHSLRVRMGCTAGEPVAQNEDLFGATVQLAARLCSTAEPEQILVSSVIRELCMGKDFLFADLGQKTLRGFDEPVRVYEVQWRG
jgi:class 3 adenylate cyclase